jgi:hypothetical protein
VIGQLSGFALECPDPAALAAFYAEVTGASIDYTSDDWCSLKLTDSLHLSFQRSVDYRPPVWPDPHSSMQYHLHIKVADLDMAQLAVELLGGRPLPDQPSPETARVMADPVGHILCLVPAQKSG